MSEHHEVLIIGGGTAGITVAARLCNLPRPPEIGIIEPSTKHYYQPLWTLVGGGVFPKEASERNEADFIPPGATWIQDAVTTFDPDKNTVCTRGGNKYTYDVLVVAPGIQLDWDKVTGLKDTLGKNGVCSNYAYDLVDSTWGFLREFRGGKAIFTFPNTPIKCAGAPQKIMWLAEHYMRRIGVRDQSDVIFASAGAGIFGIPHYARPLNKLVEERNIITHYRHDLVEVRPSSKEAVFRNLDDSSERVLKFDLLHVTPPQSAPGFIKESPLASSDGWVEVDKYTTQHTRYPNVFSLGDASSLPNSKTGAAVRKQAPVTVANIESFRAGKPLHARYDGYASCPLVTGYGRLILAEFGYDGVIMESFPFNQAQERYSMWAMKAYGLPNMYWHGMLRGRV
ncbi:NAD(P)/FAD-dependent oxidoreductase [Haliangium sp.]|uniref:NAD(P)/FAD-dependent oxidoreductase n=1 Tax=Haliangium sp. TaxID=2663208 RepID=UPI003D106A2E